MCRCIVQIVSEGSNYFRIQQIWRILVIYLLVRLLATTFICQWQLESYFQFQLPHDSHNLPIFLDNPALSFMEEAHLSLIPYILYIIFF